MKRTILALAVAAAVSACASAPETFDVKSSEEVQADFDKTWQAVIATFAENTIPIKTLEKDSGLIVAEQSLVSYQSMDQVASCGTGSFVEVPSSGIATYNVFVRPVNAIVTKVQVNTKFAMQFRDSYNNSRVQDCNSRSSAEIPSPSSIRKAGGTPIASASITSCQARTCRFSVSHRLMLLGFMPSLSASWFCLRPMLSRASRRRILSMCRLGGVGVLGMPHNAVAACKGLLPSWHKNTVSD